MREHLPGVARRSMDPTDPASAPARDGVTPRRPAALGVEFGAPEPEPRLLALFAAMDSLSSKSPCQASR